MPSFKDVYNIDEEEKKVLQKSRSNAASAILAAHTTKDRRFSIRISTQLYTQFTQINSKLGASSGSVVNTLMSQYVLEHKELLDDSL